MPDDTTSETLDVALVAGPGLVARRGARVVVLRPAATTAQVERVLSVLDRPARGRRFVEAVGAAAVASGCLDVAAVAADDAGATVLVRGGLAALVGGRVLDGRDADGWLQEAVAGDATSVLVAPPGDHPRVTLASSLVEGVVPAAGVEVQLGGSTARATTDQDDSTPLAAPGAPAGPTPPAPPPGRRAAAEDTGERGGAGAPPRGVPNAGDALATASTRRGDDAVSRAGAVRSPGAGGAGTSPPAAFVDLTQVDDSDLPRREPLAVVTSERPAVAGGEPEDDGVVLVDGVSCVRGHFNRPDVLYCSVCGISMVHATLVLKPGPRPPLGVLVADDGASWRLDGDYLVGRRPPASDLDPDLRPLVLSDPEQSVSRAHAEVRLSGWDVLVVDRGSSNGTFVAAPGEAWQRLTPGQARMLEPGEWVLLGRRVLVYEGHHVRGDQPGAA